MSYINSFMYKLEIEGNRLEDGNNNIYRITLHEWDKEFIFLPRDKVKGFLKENNDEFEKVKEELEEESDDKGEFSGVRPPKQSL